MDQIVKKTQALIAELGRTADAERQKNRRRIAAINDLVEVPDSPGCYWIETTMPISEFDQKKRRSHPPKKSVGFHSQEGNGLYVIYSGTQANLRQRLQQHLSTLVTPKR